MLRSYFNALALCWCFIRAADAFQFHSFGRSAAPSRTRHFMADQKDYNQGEVGSGDNWIERSFPVDTEEGINVKKAEDYNLGISGEAFQTGSLSKKMFDAITSRTSLEMSDEIREAFTLYAMDFTAKEAARAALTQNGLEMVLQEEEEDQGMWGDVEAIRLYDMDSGIAYSKLFDSLEDAVQNWSPGQKFDFVARQVPAKVRELSVEELVEALDPDGKLREEAGADAAPDEEGLLSIFDESDINSLAELASDNVRRSDNAPRRATVESDAFAGLSSKGYSVINRSDLLGASKNSDESENEATLKHVMHSLVSHGVLLVDLTDAGKNFDSAKVMAEMWKATSTFFEKVKDDDVAAEMLPGMTTVMETGSQHAKVGYSTFDSGSLKFLETRRERGTGALLPLEATNVVGAEGTDALQSAYDVVAQVCKDIVRVAVAASSVEHGAFKDAAQASKAAELLVEELTDDGKPLRSNSIDHLEGTVSMSPHRLCRYAEGSDADVVAREVFGAHVDATFLTAVPVAAISGLEVYDEEAEKWYRPELKARDHWKRERAVKGSDASSLVEDVGDGIEIPWHARYIAIMAGEHLQLATRNEIPATVHRVVAAKDGPARLSAPILLRPRPGTKFLVERYMGSPMGSYLLSETNGMTMDEIYDATQSKPINN